MEGRFINRRQRSKHLVAIATKEVVKRDQFVIYCTQNGEIEEDVRYSFQCA